MRPSTILTSARYFIMILIVCGAQIASAQDSTAAPTVQRLFGFQFSLVSGTGISFGTVQANNIRLKATGGFITNDDKSTYSIGADLHYVLGRGNKVEVSVGPSFGIIGGTNELTKTRIALATTVEVPFNGANHYENVCAGLVLYYPTVYILSGNINVTAGLYLSYYF
ncbi:MAG: hypothetical protein HUU02_11730 [Bacteroidetes bacterium]|nr:hypothetical protein [Bacteroidota bacterium]